MPTAYGYLRVSHEDQADNGNSIETQKRIVMAKFDDLKRQYPDLEWGGLHEELAVSAWQNMFFCRPEAVKLNGKLKKGDMVIFSRVDRAFRKVHDMLNTITRWGEMGVGCCFCDIATIDTTSPMGRFSLTIYAAMAEVYVALLSARTKEAMQTLKEQGRPVNGNPGIGKKTVYSVTKGYKIVIDDEDLYWIGKAAHEWRQRGLGWERISDEIEDLVAKEEGRDSHRPWRSMYKYTHKHCRRLAEIWHAREQELDSILASDSDDLFDLFSVPIHSEPVPSDTPD